MPHISDVVEIKLCFAVVVWVKGGWDERPDYNHYLVKFDSCEAIP